MAASKLLSGDDPWPTAMPSMWPGSGWDSANRPRQRLPGATTKPSQCTWSGFCTQVRFLEMFNLPAVRQPVNVCKFEKVNYLLFPCCLQKGPS